MKYKRKKKTNREFNNRNVKLQLNNKQLNKNQLNCENEIVKINFYQKE